MGDEIVVGHAEGIPASLKEAGAKPIWTLEGLIASALRVLVRDAWPHLWFVMLWAAGDS